MEGAGAGTAPLLLPLLPSCAPSLPLTEAAPSDVGDAESVERGTKEKVDTSLCAREDAAAAAAAAAEEDAAAAEEDKEDEEEEEEAEAEEVPILGSLGARLTPERTEAP